MAAISFTRPSAIESDATRSAAMPTSCSERAVLRPMAATLVPWSALESSPASRRRPNTASDGVRAGEYNPVEAVQSVEGLVKLAVVLRRFNADSGDLHDVCSSAFQQPRKHAGLGPRPGDEDAPAEQRAVVEPANVLSQPRHIAKDGHDRWAEPASAALLDHVGRGCRQRCAGAGPCPTRRAPRAWCRAALRP